MSFNNIKAEFVLFSDRYDLRIRIFVAIFILNNAVVCRSNNNKNNVYLTVAFKSANLTWQLIKKDF